MKKVKVIVYTNGESDVNVVYAVTFGDSQLTKVAYDEKIQNASRNL